MENVLSNNSEIQGKAGAQINQIGTLYKRGRTFCYAKR
jgi:hypothetical protein